jgi:hypothetical protein
MKNASTKKNAEPDSSPEIDLTSGRFQRLPKRERRNYRYTLALLREARGKTQADLARATGMQQSEISRLERRSDVLVSTLRKYAEALGGTCEIVFSFPTGHRHIIVDPPEKA